MEKYTYRYRTPITLVARNFNISDRENSIRFGQFFIPFLNSYRFFTL